MKNIIIKSLLVSILFLLNGCSTKIFQEVDKLQQPVANIKNATNHFTSNTYDLFLNEDIEDVSVYLPKNTTTLRVMIEIANIEDVVYMKLIDDSSFSIDKVLRRVENIDKLGYEQDGYVYEPSVLKNIIVLQLYVPSIYLYNNLYKPKLVFAFKRNSRTIQEKMNFYLIKQRLSSVVKDEKYEVPFYSNVKEYCDHNNTLENSFSVELSEVNEERVDEEFVTELKRLCK